MNTDGHGLRGARIALGLLIAFAALSGAQPEALAGEETVAPALTQEPLLYEVVRHLYRWYMDETDAEKIVLNDTVTFWVRGLHPQLDPDDRSQLGEIVIPAVGLAVKMKRAEYEIPELNVSVSNDTFRIINIERRTDLPAAAPPGYVEVTSDYVKMREYLFTTRNKLEFPEGAFLKSLRLAVREEIREELEDMDRELPDADPVIHFSSISPVANELWVFWESGRILMHIASDIDLSNPDVWKHGEMAVRLFDIDEQVVVSLDEVAGSNAYMTRDQVGRALFNCVVLGRRVVLEPLEDGD